MQQSTVPSLDQQIQQVADEALQLARLQQQAGSLEEAAGLYHAILEMQPTCGTRTWRLNDRPLSRHLRVMRALGLPLLFLGLAGCNSSESSAAGLAASVQQEAQGSKGAKRPGIWMTVGGRRFPVTLADSQAARDLAAELPLTLDMAELNGNEKHGELPRALPGDASRPGTIRNGDLMLYGSNTLVIFYRTFESSFSYTRLGRVDDSAGLVDALGRGSVQIVLSKQ